MKAIGEKIPGFRGRPDGVTIDASEVWTICVLNDAPAPSEVAAIARGHVDVSIDREGPALVWMLRAGDNPWSAVAWPHWERRVPRGPVPKVMQRSGVGVVVQVVLIDTRSGKIEAVRTIGLTVAIAAAVDTLEGSARDAGRDEEAWKRALEWTRTAEPDEIGERAARAPAVTSVAAKGAS